MEKEDLLSFMEEYKEFCQREVLCSNVNFAYQDFIKKIIAMAVQTEEDIKSLLKLKEANSGFMDGYESPDSKILINFEKAEYGCEALFYAKLLRFLDEQLKIAQKEFGFFLDFAESYDKKQLERVISEARDIHGASSSSHSNS